MELKRAKALKYQLTRALRALNVLGCRFHRSTKFMIPLIKRLRISHWGRIQATWTIRAAKVQSLKFKTIGMSNMRKNRLKSPVT